MQSRELYTKFARWPTLIVQEMLHWVHDHAKIEEANRSTRDLERAHDDKWKKDQSQKGKSDTNGRKKFGFDWLGKGKKLQDNDLTFLTTSRLQILASRMKEFSENLII